MAQTTKHSHPVVFGRKQDGCDRCTELKLGAPTRAWAGYSNAQTRSQQLAAIRGHSCAASRCMSVCTFGDY
jgi:hypothetical protein